MDGDEFVRDAVLSGQIMDDLLRVGLLAPEETGLDPVLKAVDPALSLFMPMLKSFDIRLVPMVRKDCPVHFCTAILKPTPDQQLIEGSEPKSIPAGGQSRTSLDAALGCLGELSERISLWSLGARDTRIFSRQNTQPEVDLGSLLGLSGRQSRDLARQMRLEATFLKDGIPSWETLSSNRINIRSLASGNTAQLPSIGVLFSELERETGRKISFASSVGCAVWRDLEGARERALLELVERDAVSQAWYNRLGITRIEQNFLREILSEQLIEFLSVQDRLWSVFSVQSELAGHVVMAISYEEGGFRTAFGASAGWDIVSACESALQEMLQSENALQLMERAYPANRGESQADVKIPRQLSYARTKSILEDLCLEALPAANEQAFQETFTYDRLLESCLDRNFEIWEFDATRPDLKVPCIKLLSPDLVSWEPRFGKKRLYNGVVERGLRSEPALEAEFAARPFPF